jgi:hypothetical protein
MAVKASFLNNLIICISILNIISMVYSLFIEISLFGLQLLTKVLLLHFIVKFKNDPAVIPHVKVFYILLVVILIGLFLELIFDFIVSPQLYNIFRLFRIIEILISMTLIYKGNIIRIVLKQQQDTEHVNMYNLFDLNGRILNIVPSKEDNTIEITKRNDYQTL